MSNQEQTPPPGDLLIQKATSKRKLHWSKLAKKALPLLLVSRILWDFCYYFTALLCSDSNVNVSSILLSLCSHFPEFLALLKKQERRQVKFMESKKEICGLCEKTPFDLLTSGVVVSVHLSKIPSWWWSLVTVFVIVCICNEMGFEGSGDSKMFGLGVTSRHNRSKSFPDKKKIEEDTLSTSLDASHRAKLDMGRLKETAKARKKELPYTEVQKELPYTEVQNSLKQEIQQLEKRLHDQFEVRCALEQALGYRTSSHGDTDKLSMPKPATELIKEIAVLELEVVYLEQYLLSLYRKAFDQQISSVSPTKAESLKSPLATTTPRRRLFEVSASDISTKGENPALQSGCQLVDNPWKESSSIGEEKLLDSGVHHCHSTLSQQSAFPTRTSPEESLGRAVRACHSQQLPMMEYAQNATNIISLAEHLGTRISDHVPETPNKLSEDMIKCMSAIYCKLAHPPLTHNGLLSPNSSLSSTTAFSPKINVICGVLVLGIILLLMYC